MTDWLFDLGNSRLKCVALDATDADRVLAFDHDSAGFGTDAMARLPRSIGTAFVASVAAAPVRLALLDVLAARARRICMATSQARFAGLRIGYPVPAQLGVDRFLAMLGARDIVATQAWLLVGVGTALTIDLVDRHGLHRGGRIAASPQLAREALHGRARQLPLEGGTPVMFADNTRDALASGCDGAASALVRDSLAAGAALLGERPALLLHGGGAAALRAQLLQPDQKGLEQAGLEQAALDQNALEQVGLDQALLEPALVLRGLAAWAHAESRPAAP